MSGEDTPETMPTVALVCVNPPGQDSNWTEDFLLGASRWPDPQLHPLPGGAGHREGTQSCLGLCYTPPPRTWPPEPWLGFAGSASPHSQEQPRTLLTQARVVDPAVAPGWLGLS